MDWAERLGFFTKILKPLYENDRSRAWYQAITWMILGYVEILMHIMWANVKETKFKPKNTIDKNIEQRKLLKTKLTIFF